VLRFPHQKAIPGFLIGVLFAITSAIRLPMGKKNKDEAPNPNGIANRDILQRLSFLYQASTYLESISHQSDVRRKARVDSPINTADVSSTTSTLSTARKGRHQERQRKRREITTADIGQAYVRTMKSIGQKTTVKMYVLSPCDMCTRITSALSGTPPSSGRFVRGATLSLYLVYLLPFE